MSSPYALPVEVLEQIIAYALAPAKDDLQKLSSRIDASDEVETVSSYQ